MALTGNITAIIDLGERAYPHLYDIEISLPPTMTSVSIAEWEPFLKKKAVAETIQYDGNRSVESFYSEALFSSFPEKAQRIKGFTVSFRETANFDYYRMFNAWISSYYDEVENYFKPGDPRGSFNTVIDIATGNNRIFTMKHSGIICKSVQNPQFSYNSTEPLITVVSFSMEDFSFELSERRA